MKKSYRETLEENDRAQRAWGVAFGKEVPARVLNALPPKRAYTKRQAPEASESAILKAIMQLLKHHPKVARVWRQNSGVFQVGERFIRANTARGMSDIQAVLKSGKSMFIEVKSAKGSIEPHQQAFLEDMTRAGAVAFVARDAETVMRVLAAL